ncbi:hypothetical protein GJ744_003896 [Endocarpon pusillum]|uniref:Uncharacterized protein n=1 Tax=Endocarpon pusillum TaxID=364733 RepID=A0A8H7E0D5_9EURO|nr:hypothetical protein GJ744_003896 [Endocarpon pusillum]
MTMAPTRPLSSNAGGPRESIPLDSGFSLQSRPTPELEKLADTFAERLPDGIFSPAEV